MGDHAQVGLMDLFTGCLIYFGIVLVVVFLVVLFIS